MDPERWDKLQRLFESARELDPSARAQFLDTHCGDDTDLRRELESLLAHATRPETSFGDIVGSAAVDLFEQPDPWEGRTIGRYTITEKIAEGGMGAVYRGERSDETYRQDVAIKLLGNALVSQAAKQRFVNERQILANLNHPNIATLIDGGTTDEGIPYLVMEYVEGVPIDEYCDSHHLTNRRRLALFLELCGAIQYAHQNLVVHRDIKPGNILVTEGGTAKLLDFGIAKLQGEDHATGPALTRADMRLLTPEYASPEQIRGEAVTTATDVYALGLLLYQLLTGSPPYRVAGLGPADLERTICTTDPERPSTLVGHTQSNRVALERATSLAGLRRQLKGDLDNIVLLALRKEPAERYSTVRELADDVQRYLNNLPVHARSASVSYRLQKFVQRNRLPVGTGAAMLALTVILITFYTVRLAHERDAANQARDAAQAVTDFLVEIFEVSDPSEARGNTITAREVLDRGNERLEVELKDQPETRARLLEAIGRVYYGLGLYGDARTRFGEAVSILERAGASDVEIAEVLSREAAALMRFGDNRGAAEMLDDVLRIQERALPPSHPEIVRSHISLGEAQFNQGEVDASIESCARALELSEGFTGEDVRLPAQALLCLGTAHLSRREMDPAEAYLKRGSELLTAEFGADYPDLLDMRHELAGIYFFRGEYPEAIRIWEEVAAGQARSLGEFHANVGRTWGSIASAYWGLDEIDEAEAAERKSLAIFEKTLAPDHRDFAKGYYTLAGLLRARYQLDESEQMYRKVVDIQRRISDPNDPDLGNTLAEMALVLRDLGRFDEAEAALRESIAMQEVSLGHDHLWVALSVGQLGEIMVLQGQVGEGLAMIDDGLSRALATTAPEHHHVTTIRRYRGVALGAAGRFDEALEVLDHCLELDIAHYGPDKGRIAGVLLDRAEVKINAGHPDAALDDLERAMEIQSRELGPTSPGLGPIYYQRARAYLAVGDAESGRRDAARAYELMSPVQPDTHPIVAASHKLAQAPGASAP